MEQTQMGGYLAISQNFGFIFLCQCFDFIGKQDQNQPILNFQDRKTL
jgi:hypothetical protein